MSTILKADAESIQKAARIIQQGGIVAFPTETVYGLGADVYNARAVARIFEVKQRPYFDPLIVHVAEVSEVENIWLEVPEKARQLINHFWPGPLTLVLPRASSIPDIVTAGLRTVAVRMPAHEVALQIIRAAGVPVAAPSANLFGHLSPTTAEHVAQQLGESIDLIIDGGRCPVGVESTVLDLTTKPTLLRPGGIPVEEIEKLIGRVQILETCKKPRSPGQLTQHYAPRTPLRILKNKNYAVAEGKNAGLLAFQNPDPIQKLPFKQIEILSARGDLREAACNLFPCLHRLDQAGLDIIYAEPVPEVGLGRAIMDRLRKAQGIKLD